MSNTWLKREEKRKATFRMGKNETEIDFMLTKKVHRRSIKKCEGNPWGVSPCLIDSRHILGK